MKARRLSIYTRIALVAMVAGIVTACVPVRDDERPPRHRASTALYFDYWYYPAIDSYYDPRSRVYIYFEHDHWVRARVLPVRVRSYLGKHVVVRSPHERPYEQHRQHRERYAPGQQAPELDRKTPSGRRDKDARIGAPRQSTPQSDRNERRENTDRRERNASDLDRSPERGSRSVPARDRPADANNSRPPRKARAADAAAGQQEPLDRASVRQGSGAEQQSRKNGSRARSRNTSDRRSRDSSTNEGNQPPRDGRRRTGYDDKASR